MKKLLPLIALLTTSLSAADFVLAGDKVNTLKGGWQFHWKTFIDPAEIPVGGSRVQVPGNWKHYPATGGASEGYGSFYAKIDVKKAGGQQVAIELPEIGGAYRFYINGVQQAQMGKPGATRTGHHSRIGNQVVHYYVSDEGTVLHFVLHVANYSQHSGGLWQAIRIGTGDEIQTASRTRVYIEGLIVGGLIFMALYHLALFFSYRQQQSALYFAIFVFILAVRTLLAQERIIPTLLDMPDHWLLYKIEYLCTYSAPIAFLLFFRAIFPGLMHQLVTRSLLTVFSGLTLFALVTPKYIYNYTLLPFQLLLVGVIVYILFLNVLALVKRLEGARSLIVGFLILGGAIIFDIMLTRGLSSTIKLTPVGVLFLTLAQAYILKDRFSNAMKKVQHLSEELQETNQVYARFVPQQFISNLGKKSIVELQLRDTVQKTMTVLFCDIRGFTPLSETMTPEENFRFINSYLSRISPVIESHGGFIDKFIGDAIMALFPDEPDKAVAAAVEMQHALREYNQHRANQGYEPISAGVGLHTGDLALGIIGNEVRWSSTVISDSVNLAARIESLTKKLGAKVAASAETFYQQTDPGNTTYRFLGRIKVKGKTERIPVFEILNAYTEDELPYFLTSKVYFERGVNLLSDGKIEKAVEDFRKVRLMNPRDKVTRFYLHACEARIKKIRAKNQVEL